MIVNKKSSIMKFVLKSFFLCLLIVTVNQLEAQSKVTFGAKAGVNIANFSYSNNDPSEKANFKSILGFQFGGIVNFSLSDKIAIETGVELQGRGAKSVIEDAGETFELKITPLYLTVPVMLQYKTSRFIGNFGPFVDFGISGNLSGGGLNESIKFGNEIGDLLRSSDIGLRFGIAYHLDMGLRFGLNYDLGLTNVIPEPEGKALNEISKHRDLGITIGYMF